MDVNRLSRAALEKILKDMKGSTLRFNTEMNQNPTDESSSPIKREWFPIVSTMYFFELVKKHNAYPFFYLDTAFTDNKPTKPGRRANRNDPSAIMCCFLIENDLYIYKVLRDFLTGPDLIDKVKEFLTTCNYHVTKSTLSIELKASGHTVFQFLKKDGINVKASPDPKDDKQTRLLAISGSLSSGRVKLVEGAWNGSFLDEVCIPPEVRKYWDQTDLLSSSVEELIGGDKPRKVTKSRLH